MRNVIILGLGVFSLLMSSRAVTAESTPIKDDVNNEQNSLDYESDNTGRNKRDRNDLRKTAGDQSNDQKEIDVSAQIRKELVNNKELSMTAKNVKIIVEPGQVTLRGPVKSVQERKAVEEIAIRLAKGYKVTSELEQTNG